MLVHNCGEGGPPFTNKMGGLEGELALADKLGVKPVSPGIPGFDNAIASGRINWAVLEDGTLVVTPQRVAGQPINHTVLSRGNPVMATVRPRSPEIRPLGTMG